MAYQLTYFLLASISIGVLIGFLGYLSRFCTMAGIRNLLLFRHMEMFMGAIGILVGGSVGSLILSLIAPTSFPDFPVLFKVNLFTKISKDVLMFIGCLGLGIVSTYADGCPFRMHVKAGSGNFYSLVYLVGFYLGILYFILFLQDLIMSTLSF